MPLFGPPNVKKLRAKGDVKGLIKALGYTKDENVRMAAAAVLGEIGGPAVEPLMAALNKGGAGDFYTSAIAALVWIGDPALEPLIAALKDENWLVASAAASALGQIGDPRAVEPLIAALENGSRVAAWALGQIGDARAVEPLIAALEDEKENVREAAAEALGQIGDPRVVEPLIAALEEEKGDVREAAAKALGQIGDARAVEPLIVVIKEFKPITAMDWDAGWPMFVSAASALGEIGDARAVKPFMDALDNLSFWADIIDESAERVGYIGGRKARTKVLRVFIFKVLGQIGAPAVQALIAALKDENGDVREYAAKALGEIGDTRAVVPLIAVLKDKGLFVGLVKRAAAVAMGQIGSPRAKETLIGVLQDEDEGEAVRQAAAEALEKIEFSQRIEAAKKSGQEEGERRRCKLHDTTVRIHRLPDPKGGQIVLLACEHTFLRDIFRCNAKCAYSIGAQMEAKMGAQMALDEGLTVPLNPDGTIPLALLEAEEFVDYTS